MIQQKNHNYQSILEIEDIGKCTASNLEVKDLLNLRITSVRMQWIMELVLIERLNARLILYVDINTKTHPLDFFMDCSKITLFSAFHAYEDLKKIAKSFTQLKHLDLSNSQSITSLQEIS